jgi:hypothetical protein
MLALFGPSLLFHHYCRSHYCWSSGSNVAAVGESKLSIQSNVVAVGKSISLFCSLQFYLLFTCMRFKTSEV